MQANKVRSIKITSKRKALCFAEDGKNNDILTNDEFSTNGKEFKSNESFHCS